MSNTPEQVSLRIVLDVTYNAADVPAESLTEMARDMIHSGISNGGLTGSTEATVEVYDVTTTTMPAQPGVAQRLRDALFTLEEDHAEFGQDFTWDEWIVAVSRNPESTAHAAACEFIALTQGTAASRV